MGWDRKRRGRAGGYFYRSVRVPGRARPVKVYVGAGPAGAAAARAVAARRAARGAATAERAAAAERDRVLADAAALATGLIAAALVTAGWHKHRGTWRRRKGAPVTLTEDDAMVGTSTAAPGGPTGGGPNPWAGVAPHARVRFLRDFAQAADRGDPDARRNAALLLATYPELIAEFGTLADRAEAAFAAAIGAGDPVAAAVVRAEADRLRAELGGGTATGLERVAVDQVVAAYLADRDAQLWLAAPGPTPAADAARCRRAAVTGRRYLDAVRALHLVRSKRPPVPN